MGLFDFIKKKEIEEIDRLRKETSSKDSEINILKQHIDNLKQYEDIIDAESKASNIITLAEQEAEHIVSSAKNEVFTFERQSKNLQEEIDRLKDKVKRLDTEIKSKEKEVVELNDKILLQEFGLYTPIYDFVNSDQYKDKLDYIRLQQKNMILSKTAATCSQSWTVNGSEAQGRMMTEQNIKQILRCFNDECDILVDKVKFNNVGAYITKMHKSYEALNRMNTKNAVSLSWDYLQLKVNELKLAHEYALKKQEEKEEQKRVREQLREEAKLQKEIEEARKDIEKEQKHYANALLKLTKQLEACDDTEKDVLYEKKKEIEQHLTDLDVAIKDIDYREANKKAGYVYIISNIGSFGENVYKIGMTRRLDPMERVDELGDASVPFKFDVHAMIFSDDAPKLEAALHRAFENKKVNMINNRREFFKVTLDEIESVVKCNYDKTVEFDRTPNAEQYRESIKILESLSLANQITN